MKKWRKDNAKHIREYNKKWREKNRKEIGTFLMDYKLSNGCAICGYNKCAAALEFHHTDCRKVGDKKFHIAKAYSYNMKLEKIKEEIKKCIILCVNCHREYHEKERPYKHIIWVRTPYRLQL